MGQDGRLLQFKIKKNAAFAWLGLNYIEKARLTLQTHTRENPHQQNKLVGLGGPEAVYNREGNMETLSTG